MVGKTIAHCQILEKLGEGAMGVAYKARDTHLNRSVALKVLSPEKVADPERKRTFVQEAQSASALSHPNTIHIYDVDQQDGCRSRRFSRTSSGSHRRQFDATRNSVVSLVLRIKRGGGGERDWPQSWACLLGASYTHDRWGNRQGAGHRPAR